MGIRLALLAAAGLAIVLADPAPHPESASIAAGVQTDEWSAARKPRRYRAPAYVYRAPTYGRLGDPSLGPNGLPYRRPYDRGGCIIDEGYGRFSACSDR